MVDSLQPQLKVSFRKSIAMGPGKAALLDAISKNGSISAAARELGMSYRRAWILVNTMNNSFLSPLVETLTGGKRGGGARVTEFGEEVLYQYRSIEEKATKSVRTEMRRFSEYMRD